MRKILLLLFSLILISSCVYYQRYPMAKTRLKKIKYDDLTFYMIDPSRPLSGMWYVSTYDFREKDLTARLERIPEREALVITNIGSRQDARLSKNDVLIYVKPEFSRNFGDTLTTKLTYEQLERVEVYEANFGKSVIMSFAGYVSMTILLAALVSGGFCQPVYAAEADACTLQGELFAGAAWRNAARTEYLQLPNAQADDGAYHVCLAGKNEQVQHLDALDLHVIDHPRGVRVLYDRLGKMHTVTNPVSPTKALDNQQYDLSKTLLAADQDYWLGALDTRQKGLEDHIELTFEKPQDAQNARLVLRAKNSFWLDVMFAQYRLDYPDACPDDNSRAEDIAQWLLRQKIPLTAWVQTADGRWQRAGYFLPNGPFTFRDEVLEIDLSKHKGNTIKIKLEAGAHFWEIDQVALDFSAPAPTRCRILPAQTDGEDANVQAAILQTDGLFAEIKGFGRDLALCFRDSDAASQPAGTADALSARSIFLRGNGYYTFENKAAPQQKQHKQISLPAYAKANWKAFRK